MPRASRACADNVGIALRDACVTEILSMKYGRRCDPGALEAYELYFASLGGEDGRRPQVLADMLARDFGSVDRWRSEFVAMGNALGGGSGWVLLVYVPRERRLDQPIRGRPHARRWPAAFRSWRSTCTSTPITSTSAPTPSAYVDAFMRNIDWNGV